MQNQNYDQAGLGNSMPQPKLAYSQQQPMVLPPPVVPPVMMPSPVSQTVDFPMPPVIRNKKKVSARLIALICTVVTGLCLTASVICTICFGSDAYEADRDYVRIIYERDDDSKGSYDAKKAEARRKDREDRQKKARLQSIDNWEIRLFWSELRIYFATLFTVSAVWLIVSCNKKQ